jgi:hypothetical protein
VEQVATELSGGALLIKALICSGQHPHIGPDHLLAADACPHYCNSRFSSLFWPEIAAVSRFSLPIIWIIRGSGVTALRRRPPFSLFVQVGASERSRAKLRDASRTASL